jgi:hypothetical protein
MSITPHSSLSFSPSPSLSIPQIKNQAGIELTPVNNTNPNLTTRDPTKNEYYLISELHLTPSSFALRVIIAPCVWLSQAQTGQLRPENFTFYSYFIPNHQVHHNPSATSPHDEGMKLLVSF